MKFWDTGEETNTATFDYDVMKKKFIENLDYLKEMSVEEQTLYKKWIEWNEDGTFKSEHSEPAIGRSLLMSPFNRYFTWHTTPITAFKPIDNGFMFVTKNSTYTLTKIDEPSV